VPNCNDHIIARKSTISTNSAQAVTCHRLAENLTLATQKVTWDRYQISAIYYCMEATPEGKSLFVSWPVFRDTGQATNFGRDP